MTDNLEETFSFVVVSEKNTYLLFKKFETTLKISIFKDFRQIARGFFRIWKDSGFQEPFPGSSK